MSKEELNRLVLQYRNTRCETVFEKVYSEVSRVWGRAIHSDAVASGTNEWDVRALYEDTLLEVIEAFDPEKSHFEHLLNASLLNAKKDLQKEKSRLYQREMYGIMRGHGADEDSAATLDIESDTGIPEEDAIASVQRKRDQRQLISFLVANEDDFTKDVVELLPHYETYKALGKALGTYGVKVSRTLSRLSRKYDEELFGDLSDYLTA